MRTIARAAFLRFALMGAASITLALATMYCALAGRDNLTRAAAIVGFVLTVYTGFLAEKSRIQLARARAGMRAERIVGRALTRIDAEHVIHGAIVGGGGDCDHLVLGPWAVAVETKSGGGPVSVDKGILKAGTKVIPRDAISQARRQASAASRQLGVTVKAVVCVVDATNVVVYDDVTICGHKHLQQIIAASPRSFRTGAAETHARRISQNTDRHTI